MSQLPTITAENIQHILTALHRSWSTKKAQNIELLVDQLPNSFMEQLQQILKGALDGDIKALTDLDAFFQSPLTFCQRAVRSQFPDLSEEQHELASYLMLHVKDIKTMASRWFRDLEEHACSYDKASGLFNILWRHATTGCEPSPNYNAQYTYHLSSGTLLHGHEYLAWLHAFKMFQMGDVDPYFHFMAQCKLKQDRRFRDPDLPAERLPTLENIKNGVNYVVTLAGLKHYLPTMSHHDLRAVVVYRQASFRVFEDLIKNKKTFNNITTAMMNWALKDTSIQTNRVLAKMFPTNDLWIEFLTIYLRDIRGEEQCSERSYQVILLEIKMRYKNKMEITQ